MSTAETTEFSEILDRVMRLSPVSRISLAKRILDSLGPPAPAPESPRKGRSVQEFIGLGAGEGPPPDDATIKQWIDEHRMEKYG